MGNACLLEPHCRQTESRCGVVGVFLEFAVLIIFLPVILMLIKRTTLVVCSLKTKNLWHTHLTPTPSQPSIKSCLVYLLNSLNTLFTCFLALVSWPQSPSLSLFLGRARSSGAQDPSPFSHLKVLPWVPITLWIKSKLLIGMYKIHFYPVLPPPPTHT